MCGILGKISGDAIDTGLMQKALCLMNDRGPDNQEIKLFSENVCLGHSRLSIIDLSKAANQPLSLTEDIHITFNGEIYNYLELKAELIKRNISFITHSDTEVLLRYYAEFGIDKTLNKAVGMFSFAILDRTKNMLLLARDHFGQKPLFYNLQKGLSFASTIESLKIISEAGGVDPHKIQDYLCFKFNPHVGTFYKNINRLPHGHYLRYDLNTKEHQVNQYWSFTFHGTSQSIQSVDIDAGLLDSVRIHCRSDVPVGVFLSGGIDSSLIAHYTHKINPEIHAIHIQFNQEENDESHYAKHAANTIGIPLEIIRVDKFKSNTIDILDTLIRKVGEPYSDPALLSQYMVSDQAKKMGITVVLTGDGGDEVFCGYGISRKAAILNYLKIFSKVMPQGLLRNFNQKRVKEYLSFSQKRYISLYLSLYEDVFSQLISTLNPDIVVKQNISEFNQGFILNTYKNYVPQFSQYDFNYKLPNEFLVKIDTASMCHSVETRSPFLNHNLFDILWNESVSKMVTPFTTKRILKNKAESLFGKEFAYRRKTGFEAPVEKWFLGQPDLYNSVFDKSNKIFMDGYLDFDKTRMVSHNKYLLWRYICLILWMQQA